MINRFRQFISAKCVLRMEEISSYVERAEYLRKLVIIQELLFEFSYCYYPEAFDAYHARFSILGIFDVGVAVVLY